MSAPNVDYRRSPAASFRWGLAVPSKLLGEYHVVAWYRTKLAAEQAGAAHPGPVAIARWQR